MKISINPNRKKMNVTTYIKHAKTSMRNALLMLSALVLSGTAFISCDKGESYADLLRDEEKAVNWYLAQHRVETEAPANAEDFEIGENAPYYRMNADGTVYMQVINRGDLNDRPKKDDKVYFRFERINIKNLWQGGSADSQGNMDNLDSNIGATSLFYGNTTYPNSTQFGTGIQVPLDYFGYYSEVNLVIKSYSGFTGQKFSSEQTACIPFMYNVKYYKPEY